MKVRHIADAAFHTAYSISHDWRCAEEAVELVFNHIDESVIKELEQKSEEIRQERFRIYLKGRLGYTPSNQVIRFIETMNI